MVHLPASGVLFTGDVLMPYLGQPFAAEGSPEGLLETLAFISSLRPRLLIHGHATLTEQFAVAAAATTLIGQGDHALALQTIIRPGQLRHPASTALAQLRRSALHRLMEQYQQSDPFKFLIYAEFAGTEIGPVE